MPEKWLFENVHGERAQMGVVYLDEDKALPQELLVLLRVGFLYFQVGEHLAGIGIHQPLPFKGKLGIEKANLISFRGFLNAVVDFVVRVKIRLDLVRLYLRVYQFVSDSFHIFQVCQRDKSSCQSTAFSLRTHQPRI
jgi:hypothetical protein